MDRANTSLRRNDGGDWLEVTITMYVDFFKSHSANPSDGTVVFVMVFFMLIMVATFLLLFAMSRFYPTVDNTPF